MASLPACSKEVDIQPFSVQFEALLPVTSNAFSEAQAGVRSNLPSH